MNVSAYCRSPPEVRAVIGSTNQPIPNAFVSSVAHAISAFPSTRFVACSI
jgi:hypothetical protein